MFDAGGTFDAGSGACDRTLPPVRFDWPMSGSSIEAILFCGGREARRDSLAARVPTRKGCETESVLIIKCFHEEHPCEPNL